MNQSAEELMRSSEETGVKLDASQPAMRAITVILNRVQEGDPRAAEELLPLVYEELRKLAAHRMAKVKLRYSSA